MQHEIVLVDDSPDHLELLEMAFSECGVHHVVAFVDPQKAIDHVREHHRESGYSCSAAPRLIMLDLKLGAVSGHEVLAALRVLGGACSLPVIIMSSSRIESDVRLAYENGANAYLLKPTNFDEFVNLASHVVSVWLRSNRLPNDTRGFDSLHRR